MNWTIQRRHYASFTLILGFVHALSLVSSAAFAGRSQAEEPKSYTRGIQAVWSGQVMTILTELEDRSTALGGVRTDCDTGSWCSNRCAISRTTPTECEMMSTVARVSQS